MSASRKKVIVRQLNGELHWGYLPTQGLGAAEEAELLLPDGRVVSLRLSDVQHVAYVKDFNLHDSSDPERIGPRSFLSKPRGSGVWVRLCFPNEETLEGLVHGGLGFLDSLLLERGVFLDPPSSRGNTQRMFVPRTALTGFEILGVAGGPSSTRRRTQSPTQQQGGLFHFAGEG